VAFALDTLKLALHELSSISERRIERLLNPALSNGLPPFLTADGGLNSGLMIAQYVAASLVSEGKVLVHPASADSIPTSAGQEDHVSMGATAAVHLWHVCANVERVIGIELLCGAQGLDFLTPKRPGPAVGAAHAAVREISAHLDADRSLAAEIEVLAGRIRDGSLLESVERGSAPLR
jgi:histidine ammonia-lyase